MGDCELSWKVKAMCGNISEGEIGVLAYPFTISTFSAEVREFEPRWMKLLCGIFSRGNREGVKKHTSKEVDELLET